MLLVTVTAVCVGFVFFATLSVVAAPEIAGQLIPRLHEAAFKLGFELPFTDLHSLLVLIKGEVAERFGLVGLAGTNLLRQIAFLIIGMVVAISLFQNATIVIDRDKHTLKNNLYSFTADEIGDRFELFYRSFHTVMGAQIIISAINTVFTGIFLFAVGFKYWQLLIVVTFLCGLLPIFGQHHQQCTDRKRGAHHGSSACVGRAGLPRRHPQARVFPQQQDHRQAHQNPMWMTLLGLIIGERLMGVPGMILAPVILHYVKSEASKVAVEQKAEAAPVDSP